VARAKRERELHRLLVAVVERDGGVLLFRRAEDRALLAGTWELPWTSLEPAPEQGLAERYGGRWSLGPKVGGVRHSITFRALELDVHRAEIVTPAPDGTWGWFGERERAGMPLSSLVAKVLRAVNPLKARESRAAGSR
jgi:adenine-specific DNA glycosylase